MNKLEPPKIEPVNVKQYEFKQSPYPQADKLPFRSTIVSASQGGKGIQHRGLLAMDLGLLPWSSSTEGWKGIMELW